MNIHIFIDRLTARIAAIVTGKRKFFAHSINSHSFQELIKTTIVDVPEINAETIKEVETKIGNKSFDAAFRIEKWLGNDFPTIIYHHGNNERPFDYCKGAKNTFFNIFVKQREEFRANLIVVRAPFHNCSLKTYQNRMVDLENFMSMIAVSVALNEAIIVNIRKKSSQKIITCGISLGGWVTNIHRSFYNSATVYLPLLAGTFLGEIFLTSTYRKLASRKAQQQPQAIRSLLNFNTDFESVADHNVFPMLAKYDQFIEYDIQKASYPQHPIKTVKAGHVTGALRTEALRAHILEKL